MTTVNSLSGGRTSSYMAIHYPADVNIFACVCIDDPLCSPQDPAVKKYCTDKLSGHFIASAEHEQTLKAMMDLEQLIGKSIVWVRGASFDEIIDRAGCLPTWNRRFCTTDMKIMPIFEYCYFRFGLIEERIGFRYDEAHRAYEMEETAIEVVQPTLFEVNPEGKMVLTRKPSLKVKSYVKNYAFSTKNFGNHYENRTPLTHWANKTYPLISAKINKADILSFWRSHPQIIFPDDSNCRGCHHKSKARIKANFQETPAILNWFSRQEKKKFNTWHDDQTTYEQIFATEFADLFGQESEGCGSGYCGVD